MPSLAALTVEWRKEREQLLALLHEAVNFTQQAESDLDHNLAESALRHSLVAVSLLIETLSRMTGSWTVETDAKPEVLGD